MSWQEMQEVKLNIAEGRLGRFLKQDGVAYKYAGFFDYG